MKAFEVHKEDIKTIKEIEEKTNRSWNKSTND